MSRTMRISWLGYSINGERGEAYLLAFDISGESYIIQQYRSEVGEEFVKGLAQLIREQGNS